MNFWGALNSNLVQICSFYSRKLPKNWTFDQKMHILLQIQQGAQSIQAEYCIKADTVFWSLCMLVNPLLAFWNFWKSDPLSSLRALLCYWYALTLRIRGYKNAGNTPKNNERFHNLIFAYKYYNSSSSNHENPKEQWRMKVFMI